MDRLHRFFWKLRHPIAWLVWGERPCTGCGRYDC